MRIIMSEDQTKLTIGILGGTGKEGSALAARWAMKDYTVIIGSREAEKAVNRAAELNELLGGEHLAGASNVDVATQADIVVLSVPYEAHQATLESVKEQVQGKILVDLTVPIVPSDFRTVNLPEGKSAALEAQALLGDGVKVVAAFHSVSHVQLRDPARIVDCDVLICGDDLEAKAAVIKLADAVGLRGVDAGALANAVAAESLVPVLRYINKTYGIKDAGIRITGIT
jgi:8-hydroxy-5-deazaflavin:NADPH oxidoreductase